MIFFHFFKSFCPCSKRNGLNTAFKPFRFFKIPKIGLVTGFLSN